tara:strand:- start:171 stop:914 length:744 start_codon:yes stop_codon:yes gene_type:complete
MSSRTAIDPLSITDGKISNQAKIAHKKLAPAKEGQILVAGSDGKFAATDFPETTSTTTTTVVEEESFPADSVKVGTEDGNNKYIKLGSGAGEIVTRDSNGNINANTAINSLNSISSEKADIATRSYTSDVTGNANKLDNKESTYYTNADNQTAGSSTSTNAGNGLTFTTQTIPFKQIVATYDYDAQGTGTGASSTTITHNFGYIPSARIYKISGSDLIEIEMYVTSTTTTTTVHFDYINFDIRIILR